MSNILYYTLARDVDSAYAAGIEQSGVLRIRMHRHYIQNLSNRNLSKRERYLSRELGLLGENRELYCCLCCWCFRRDPLCISANICIGHVRYCFLFNVVYFFVCTLKNSKTKRIL